MHIKNVWVIQSGYLPVLPGPRQGTKALKSSQVYPKAYGSNVAKLHLAYVVTWSIHEMSPPIVVSLQFHFLGIYHNLPH